MKMLNIFKNGETFSAGSDETIDEMHGLTGSISEIWITASQLIANERAVFRFDELSYRCDDFDANWSNHIEGYELVFNNGLALSVRASTDNNAGINMLQNIHDCEFLDMGTDGCINNRQQILAENFINQINSLRVNFG